MDSPPPLPSWIEKDPAAGAKKKRRRWDKLAKRAFFFALGLLIISLVAFFMLPVWISNEQGRAWVLGRVNQHLNGTLAVTDWQVGWFRGTRVEGLTLTLRDGKRMLQCPRITTDLTMWSLLWGNYDLGNTLIESPTLQGTRYADGQTDFSRLLRDQPTLRSLRGNIQVTGGSVLLTSQAAAGSAGEGRDAMPLQITGIDAQVPIASDTAPIHLRVRGTSVAGAASGAVEIEGNLPGLVTWPEDPLAVIADLDVSGRALPTAALAEWLGLDARWQSSFGARIEQLTFANHYSERAGASEPTLSLRGTAGSLEAHLVMIADRHGAVRGPHARHVRLSLPDPRAYTLRATVAVSEPALALLRQVNPVFASTRSAAGPIELRTSELDIDLAEPSAARAVVQVALPGMRFDRTGLMGEALQLVDGGGPRKAADTSVQASIAPLRLRVADGRIAYEDLTFRLPGRQELAFGGTVGLDGTLDLLLTVPLTSPLGSTTFQVPVTGTAAAPRLAAVGIRTKP